MWVSSLSGASGQVVLIRVHAALCQFRTLFDVEWNVEERPKDLDILAYCRANCLSCLGSALRSNRRHGSGPESIGPRQPALRPSLPRIVPEGVGARACYVGICLKI